jgi:hypothetical protein
LGGYSRSVFPPIISLVIPDCSFAPRNTRRVTISARATLGA